jgi:hypothetical protein
MTAAHQPSLLKIGSAMLVVILTVAPFTCSGGGDSRKDHMRREYERDPGAYKDKYGIPRGRND